MPLQSSPRAALGITLKLGSVTAFVASNSLVKLADSIPPGQQVFFRSCAALAPVILLMLWRGQGLATLRTARPMGHVWRGFLGCAYMFMIFVGLARLPLAEVTTMTYAGPFFVVLFSAVLLGDRIGALRWFAVATGLIGVVIVMYPRLSLGGGAPTAAETIGALAVLLGCILGSFAMLTLRGLVRTEGSMTIVLWFFIISAGLGLATLPFGWRAPDAGEWALLIGAGVAGGCGQLLLTESYRHAALSTVAPLDYFSIVIAILVGLTVFGAAPNPHMVAGGAIVLLSGAMLVLHERRARA